MGLNEKARKLTGTGRTFGSDRKGGVAMMAGFALPLLIVAAGGAIDYTNAVTTTKNAQRAMDSAVLALTRRDLETIDIQTEGEQLFNALLEQSNVRTLPYQVEFGLQGETVSGSALVENQTFFLNFIGMDTMDGKVSSTAIPPADRPIEIALVLDVSGSMGKDLNGAPRIDRLKSAVNAMFDKLDETLPSRAKVSAAVVPYSSSVNLGDFPQTLDGASVTGLPKPAFGADVWAAERYAAINGNNYTVTDAAPTTSPVPFVTAAEMSYAAPIPRLAPLTENIGNVRRTVDTMVPDGWTAGHIGMAWGVYTLSEKWKNVWPQAPEKEDDADKIIVLLSDGIFNTTHNIGDTSLELDPTTEDADGSFTPYKNSNPEESDAYFQNVCDMAKDGGVTIYAVALALDPASEAKLATCVGANGRVYPADSASQLSNAFEDIAVRLGTHRLTS